MPKQPALEIEDLREAGEDGGQLMGYYSRGHHDPNEFAMLANKLSGAEYGYDVRFVDPKHVRHVWYRTSQMADEPKGTYEYRMATPGERGAWKATVCSSVWDANTRRYRQQIREYDRGFQEGMDRALSFVLSNLEWGGNLSDKREREHRKSIAKELRDLFSQEEKSIKKQQAA